MIVWRIEHEQAGLGPYQGWHAKQRQYWPDAWDLVDELLDLPPDGPDDHDWPIPADDFARSGAGNEFQILKDQGGWRCAFASLEQLRTWFGSEWRPHLAAVGFVVKQLELRPSAIVAIGERQVVYCHIDVRSERIISWDRVNQTKAQLSAA